MQPVPFPSPGTHSAKRSSFSSPVWKRFQSELDAPLPLLVLDAEGSITTLTPAARAILDYPAGASVDPCFFTHVHGRNLPLVMRDLADVVCRRKQQASWLLRMRTGRGRWRWYRVSVRGLFDSDDGSPRVLARLRKV